MDEERYSHPTRKGRLIGRALLVCGLLLLVLVQPFSHWYVHTVDNMVDFEQSRRVLVASSLLPSIMFAALTSWLVTLGHRTITSRHWPPPGLPILYRTRIHDGQQAMVDGIICLIAGAFTGLLAVFWFYMSWRSWNM